MKYNSRAFMIRFCEEEVEINDCGHFRIEIDTDQSITDEQLISQSNQNQNKLSSFNQTEIILEMELMFSDLLGHGGPEKFVSQ